MDSKTIASLLAEQGDAIAEFAQKTRTEQAQLRADMDRLGDAVGALAARSGSPTPGFGGSADGFARKELDAAVRSMLQGEPGPLRAMSQKAMQVSHEPAGGYMVTPMLSDVIDRIVAENVPLIGAVNSVELPFGSGDAWEQLGTSAGVATA